MSGYTQDDLDSINRAIREFMAGDRVSEVICNGRRIKYADVSLQELRNLRDEIAKEMKPRRKRYQNIFSDKGLH